MTERWGRIPLWVPGRVTGGQLRVYAILSAHADSKTRLAWPAQDTIAEHLGVSGRAVRKCLHGLLETGIVEKAGYTPDGRVKYRLPDNPPKLKAKNAAAQSPASTSVEPRVPEPQVPEPRVPEPQVPEQAVLQVPEQAVPRVPTNRPGTDQEQTSIEQLVSQAAATPSQKVKKPKKRQIFGPSEFKDLLRAPYEGHPSALSYFRVTYPAYDGENGRMSLGKKLEKLKEWWDRAKSRRWKTPLGIDDALSRDYSRCRYSYERDLEQSKISLNKDESALSTEDLVLRQKLKIEAYQRQKEETDGKLEKQEL